MGVLSHSESLESFYYGFWSDFLGFLWQNLEKLKISDKESWLYQLNNERIPKNRPISTSQWLFNKQMDSKSRKIEKFSSKSTEIARGFFINFRTDKKTSFKSPGYQNYQKRREFHKKELKINWFMIFLSQIFLPLVFSE